MKLSKKTQANILKIDGERYLPWIPLSDWRSAQTHYEHLGRYYFASQIVKGKTVLDLASGEGYGAAILAQTADKVVGVDIDKNSIKFSKNKYKQSNLEFLHGEGSHIPIAGEKIFDVICCFETIEHVDEDQQISMLAEFSRLIKNDGLLIISTPNFDYTHTVLKDYENHFHKKELQFLEFTQLMSTYFSHCIYYGQKNYLANQISEIKSSEGLFKETILAKGGEAVIESSSERKIPQNYICVASKSFQDTKLAAYYTIDGDDSVMSNLYSLIELAQSERNHFQSSASDYLSAIHLSHAENDRCREEIISQKKAHEQELNAANDRCREEIISQTKAHEQELNAANDRYRDKIIALKITHEGEFNSVKIKLEEVETELCQIYKSRSWKLIQSLRTLRRTIKGKFTVSNEKKV